MSIIQARVHNIVGGNSWFKRFDLILFEDAWIFYFAMMELCDEK